jgi:hypothetical protein
LPSIEEAWNLPISAEMNSRQQQQQQNMGLGGQHLHHGTGGLAGGQMGLQQPSLMQTQRAGQAGFQKYPTAQAGFHNGPPPPYPIQQQQQQLANKRFKSEELQGQPQQQLTTMPQQQTRPAYLTQQELQTLQYLQQNLSNLTPNQQGMLQQLQHKYRLMQQHQQQLRLQQQQQQQQQRPRLIQQPQQQFVARPGFQPSAGGLPSQQMAAAPVASQQMTNNFDNSAPSAAVSQYRTTGGVAGYSQQQQQNQFPAYGTTAARSDTAQGIISGGFQQQQQQPVQPQYSPAQPQPQSAALPNMSRDVPHVSEQDLQAFLSQKDIATSLAEDLLKQFGQGEDLASFMDSKPSANTPPPSTPTSNLQQDVKPSEAQLAAALKSESSTPTPINQASSSSPSIPTPPLRIKTPELQVSCIFFNRYAG